MSTTRTIRVGGHDVTYRGEVVTFEVPSRSGGATYVCTEYVRADAPGDVRAPRPVLFVFNGGPGSSSVWTHLGIGPRRIAAADSLEPPMSPPFALVDNEDSPLDAVDLVFVDPPGTGYSRLHDGTETSDFYGVEQDAAATLEVMAQWVRRHRREQSPRYVAGESYGTLRAARIARLANGGPFRGGMTRATSLSGAMVLGPAFGLGEQAWTGDVAVALELPTLARTARLHGAATEESDDDVAAFARDELLPALVAGTTLPPARKTELATRMASMLGLAAAQIESLDLRIDPGTFARLALADRGLHLGMYDARYTLPAAAAGIDPVADDPGMGSYMPQFAGAIEGYLRDELGCDIDETYRAIDFRLTLEHWDYDGERHPRTGSFGELAEVLRRDPGFELLIGVGDFDLVTTRAATAFALSRHAFDADRVHLRGYASGHMPYLGAEPRAALAADIRSLVTRTR